MIALREFARILASHNVHAIRQDETDLVTMRDMQIHMDDSVVKIMYFNAFEKRCEKSFAGNFERIAAEIAILHPQAYPLHSCSAAC